MQTDTATLASAIKSGEREPIARLLVDWDRSGDYDDTIDDLSADIVSVQVSREVETDLPAQARLFAGSAVSQATITLKHRDPSLDPDRHTAWYYSPLNPSSPLSGVERKGAPCTLEVGFVTEAGPEYVTVLVGTVRSLQVHRGGMLATLVIADRAATMRKKVQFPMIVADGEGAALLGQALKRPGLNTTWLADYVARQCGYYASPPPRAGCALSTTLHGSGQPEIGAIQEFHGENGSKPAFAPVPGFTTPARWVMAINKNGTVGQQYTYLASLSPGLLHTNNGGELLFEGWFRFNTTAVDQPLFIAYDTGAPKPYVSMFWQASTGRLTVTYARSGGDSDHASGTSGPIVAPGTDWHYYGVQVGFTSTGVDITIRYDATTTGPFTVSSTSTTGANNLDTCGVGRGKVGLFAEGHLSGHIEAVQLTTESTTTTWNDAFIPTAEIRATGSFENRLVATPNITERGWELLQQIAASEFATCQFTETGMLAYWPRNRWTTAPYDTSQATLTPATDLADLETVEAVDQVANRVTIAVLTPVVLDSQTVWKLGSRWRVNAGQTITKIASLDDPVANIDGSVVYGTGGGSSRYLACTELNGQGLQVSNLGITLTPLSPTTIRIQINNPGTADAYMAGDEDASATFAGKPYLWIDAQIVLFTNDPGNNSRESVEASDAASIAAVGMEQILEIPDSEFRQDSDDVQQIADDLIADLADPKPALQDVPIRADPRLQLGDRVTIDDSGPEGLGFTADFHLSKVDMELDPGEGFTMTVSLRGA